MKNNIFYTLVFSVSVALLNSCGSNSKPDGGPGGLLGSTGLSIVYMSTEYDSAKGFIDHYRVHATDTNGNPVSGLHLEKSIVNGVKKIRNTKLQINSGGIESSTPIGFFDNGVDFSKTSVKAGDHLIIIPSSGKGDPSYLGDWTIQSVGSKLTLGEGSFNLESTNGLTYIVGNEQRYLGYEGGGRSANAHIETPSNGMKTDAKGFSYFDIVYDPVLGRHTVTIGVHTSGNRKSAGEVVDLRGGTLSAGQKTFSAIGGQQRGLIQTVTVGFGEGGGEHFIDRDIVPGSIEVTPRKNCKLNVGASNLHTNGGGQINLVIDVIPNEDSTEAIECTVNSSSLRAFYEY